MDRDCITITLVRPGSKGAKSFSIKISHLKAALFTFTIFTVFSLLSFTSTYMFYKDSEIKSDSVNKLLSTINIMSEDITKSEVIETKLRSRLIDIEGVLLEMQELLDKKGIKKHLSVGGEFIPPDRLSISYVEFMQKDIDEIYNTMKGLPVGSPLEGKLNSKFGYRKDPYRSKFGFHSGIDIDADYGEQVVATADGTVTKAGWHHSYGKTVIVDHKDGYETLYGHLSAVTVKEGEKVAVGEVIGKAGSTGRSTGTHLHYEVVKNGKRIDPSNYLTLN
jgi:murein DD-endopeptidase MepM/ murein hydrolase activator NlpD